VPAIVTLVDRQGSGDVPHADQVKATLADPVPEEGLTPTHPAPLEVVHAHAPLFAVIVKLP
jgi:hypothetical protein